MLSRNAQLQRSNLPYRYEDRVSETPILPKPGSQSGHSQGRNASSVNSDRSETGSGERGTDAGGFHSDGAGGDEGPSTTGECKICDLKEAILLFL